MSIDVALMTRRGPSPLVTSAPATASDHSGALEAFYMQPAHHSILVIGGHK
jgi:hypothetical protein